MKTLKMKYNRLFTGSMIGISLGLGLGVISMALESDWLVGIALIFLTVGIWLLSSSFEYERQIHSLELIEAHIHDLECSGEGEVSVVGQDTHTESGYGGSWVLSSVRTVVDREYTLCPECNVITMHNSGGDSVVCKSYQLSS